MVARASVLAGHALITGDANKCWEVIWQTASGHNELSRRDELIMQVLEELAMSIAAANSAEELMARLKIICHPLLLDGAADEKKTRSLTEQQSNASDSSVDFSMLDRLSIVPKFAQKAKAEVNANLPPATRKVVQLITDNAFFKSATIDRVKKANKAFHDPQMPKVAKTMFSNPFSTNLRMMQ